MTVFLTASASRRSSLRAVLVGTMLLGVGCRHFSQDGTTCAQGDGLKAEAYTGGQMAARTLAFTVDGGPDTATSTLVDVLTAHGVQATFFFEGDNVAADGSVLAKVKQNGHLVANRGYSGASLTTAPDPVSEVRKTDELIASYVTGNIFLLRAPDGDFSDALAKRLNDSGLTRYVGPVSADVEPPCAPEESAESCAQTAIEAIRAIGRGIIALDGTESVTSDMLRVLLPKLKNEGFLFQRLDQIAPLREALERSGATPGTVGGPGGCREYGG